MYLVDSLVGQDRELSLPGIDHNWLTEFHIRA